MHRFVASGAPARPARQKRGMIATADQDVTDAGLLLEVALEAEILIPLGQELVIYGAMRIVAARAAFPHRLMLEHERAALRDMAFGAGIHCGRSGEHVAHHRVPFMRVMTIATAHLALKHRMAVRQVKPAAHIEVALEANFRRPPGVDDRISRAARFHMHTAWSMARLAPNIFRVRTIRFQPGMGYGRKRFHDRAMAFRTGFRPDKFRIGNFRRREDRTIDRGASDKSGESEKNQCNWSGSAQALFTAF